MSKTIALLWAALFFSSLEAKWFERKAEGWFWYEEKEKKEEEQALLVSSLPLTAKEEMALIRQDLEECLNRAILEPTEENVAIYMQKQQKWIAQSSQFSQIWLKNLLNHPYLDSRLTACPITQYGIQVHKQLLREQREKAIQSLTSSYGLFFFYQGGNSTSHAFSSIVKEFAKKYAWHLIAISCDGLFLPGFESNCLNQGITKQLGVDSFPSLFLVGPKEKKAIPVAFGLSSLDQIEENIALQLRSIP